MYILVEKKNKTNHFKLPITNRYLNYRSSHHPRVKMGIIKTLPSRAEKICDTKKMENKLRRIKD